MATKLKTPDCLVGAGFLGHTWAVTATSKDTGGECLRGQTSSGPDAVRIFDEYPDSRAIYTRVRKTWKKVSRSAAMIAS